MNLFLSSDEYFKLILYKNLLTLRKFIENKYRCSTNLLELKCESYSININEKNHRQKNIKKLSKSFLK